jgi:predicted hotdog family 3-hydroxylacyl-ACP dehydratase
VLIEKTEIASLIPHAGDMILLDGVVSWDKARIQCVTATHQWIGNPLRRDGRIGILCGLEYIAQAIALHAALSRDKKDTPRRGYLASLRGVSCHVDRLDLISEPLLVEADRLLGEASRAIYNFTLRSGNRRLLGGRAAVALERSDA